MNRSLTKNQWAINKQEPNRLIKRAILDTFASSHQQNTSDQEGLMDS
jgi:hypothetical protein